MNGCIDHEHIDTSITSSSDRALCHGRPRTSSSRRMLKTTENPSTKSHYQLDQEKGRETYQARDSARIRTTTPSSYHLSTFQSLKNTLQRSTTSNGSGIIFLTLFHHLWRPSEGVKSENPTNNASVPQRYFPFLFYLISFYLFA